MHNDEDTIGAQYYGQIVVLEAREDGAFSRRKQRSFILGELLAKLPPHLHPCAVLMFEGITRAQISAKLGLSDLTVASYLADIKTEALRLIHETTPVGPDLDLNSEVDRVYDEIQALSERPATDDCRQEIELALERLKDLQHQEANEFQLRLESRLKLPLGASQRILERAEDLRMRLEDLIAQYRASPPASYS